MSVNAMTLKRIFGRWLMWKISKTGFLVIWRWLTRRIQAASWFLVALTGKTEHKLVLFSTRTISQSLDRMTYQQWVASVRWCFRSRIVSTLLAGITARKTSTSTISQKLYGQLTMDSRFEVKIKLITNFHVFLISSCLIKF